MFPKKGNFSLSGHDRENGSTRYAVMIAQALRGELGSSHRATKTLMRWTGASERTAKHWLAGHHGPGGGHLIALLRESETVYEAVLTARSEEHTSELQSLMRISYAVFFLKKKNNNKFITKPQT